jgi:hypothetical protein
MVLTKTESEFDAFLAQAIEETLRYCLGDISAKVVISYLEERNYPLEEIAKNPEFFSEELRNLLGFGRRQILGAPSILEGAILEVVCKKLGMKQEIECPPNFPQLVRKLRLTYEGNGSRR